MKDAPQLKLPSWPPKVHFLRRGLGRQGVSNLPDNNNRGDVDPEAQSEPKANESPEMLGSETSSGDYSYRKLGKPARPKWYRSRRIRFTLLAALIFGTVAIILLSTLLTRHGVGDFDTIFKVRLEYSPTTIFAIGYADCPLCIFHLHLRAQASSIVSPVLSRPTLQYHGMRPIVK
jgi:hypothetical protein